MSNPKNPLEYRRNLPHIQPKDAMFFITFRLYGSVPQKMLEQWSSKNLEDKIEKQTNKQISNKKAQENYFEALDCYLDANPNGPYYLSDNRIADIVKESIHYRDKKIYSLICYCIMSNHVHLIIYKLRKPLHIVLKE